MLMKNKKKNEEKGEEENLRTKNIKFKGYLHYLYADLFIIFLQNHSLTQIMCINKFIRIHSVNTTVDKFFSTDFFIFHNKINH